MHAIILAGGFGTRLKEVVSDVPKPLAPVAGKPFLSWLIEALAKNGVDGVTLSVHHDWQKIRDYFNAHPASIPIDYAVEEVPLGTGGAIAFALSHAKASEPVLVLNGDTFVGVDYAKLYTQHVKSNAKLTMVLREVPDTGRYGQVKVEHGVVTDFASGKAGQAGFINAGIYVLHPRLFNGYGMAKAFSFETDFMQPYVKQLQPHAYVSDGYFIDIGIPTDYARANRELPEVMTC